MAGYPPREHSTPEKTTHQVHRDTFFFLYLEGKGRERYHQQGRLCLQWDHCCYDDYEEAGGGKAEEEAKGCDGDGVDEGRRRERYDRSDERKEASQEKTKEDQYKA